MPQEFVRLSIPLIRWFQPKQFILFFCILAFSSIGALAQTNAGVSNNSLAVGPTTTNAQSDSTKLNQTCVTIEKAEPVKWPDVIIAVSGVFNIFLVLYIFWCQHQWDNQRIARESKERRIQRIREAKAFWMEEIVLRGSLADIHKTLSEYRSKMRQYHSNRTRTRAVKERDIRAWRHEIEKIRLTLVEPGLHVAPSEFAEIAIFLEDLEDLVSTEFAIDSQVSRDQKIKNKILADYDFLREKLHAKLFAVHMGILTED